MLDHEHKAEASASIPMRRFNLGGRREQCEDLLADFFSERNLIVAANRGPVTFQRAADGALEFERGRGGLVTALVGLSRYTDVTWVGCARNEADTAWAEGELTLLEGGRPVEVRFLSPDASTYHDYYGVIANPLLWFLQHSMWDIPRAPVIDGDTWEAWHEGYVVVNDLFAQALAEELRATSRPALVMLQDYHLYLTARSLRDRVSASEWPTLLHFVHIPWPGPDYWSVLPPAMRESILDGLCAVDVLGFQTRQDSRNFLYTCESLLPGAEIGRESGRLRVRYRDHTVYICDFPISLDAGALKRLAGSSEVADYQIQLRDRLGDRKIILRVDRVEPSKNILRGFHAFVEMLELYPEHREEVVFLALLMPSRMGVKEYRRYLDQVMALTGQINARYGTGDWEPIRVLVSANYPRVVAALRMYDALLVNSIADGMNLVAKEGPIVNQNHGSLILSERAGACQQLGEAALVISPCDVHGTAHELHRALTMPIADRRERAEQLRQLVEEEDITVWLCNQLQAILDLGL